LSKYKCDFVAEERRGIGKASGEGVNSRNGSWKIGWGGQVAESEHCSVSEEERLSCVHESLAQLLDALLLLALSQWRRGINRGEITLQTRTSS